MNEFHSAIYRFSLDKVANCLENKFICFFLKQFIETIDTRVNFTKTREVFEQSYGKALSILKIRTSQVISENKPISLIAPSDNLGDCETEEKISESLPNS